MNPCLGAGQFQVFRWVEFYNSVSLITLLTPCQINAAYLKPEQVLFYPESTVVPYHEQYTRCSLAAYSSFLWLVTWSVWLFVLQNSLTLSGREHRAAGCWLQILCLSVFINVCVWLTVHMFVYVCVCVYVCVHYYMCIWPHFCLKLNLFTSLFLYSLL